MRHTQRTRVTRRRALRCDATWDGRLVTRCGDILPETRRRARASKAGESVKSTASARLMFLLQTDLIKRVGGKNQRDTDDKGLGRGVLHIAAQPCVLTRAWNGAKLH